MKHTPYSKAKFACRILIPAALLVLVGTSSHALAADVDIEAAITLARKNDCFKCHAIDKPKKGPAYKKIANKYKERRDGEEIAIKHFTSAPKVKLLDDGSEVEHRIVDTKSVKEQKNLAQWILSQ